MLLSENMQGVYVIPSRENSLCMHERVFIILFLYGYFLVWFGVIFVRSGLYEDGVFRFNIMLPENFPEGDRPVRFHFVL